MEIARLYLGSIDGPLGRGTPFNGYLVKHPKGIVMIDTGFGTTLGSDARAGTYSKKGIDYPWVRRRTVEALADHGLEAGDVTYIINTHLGDHAGDNHMFPEATFIIQRPEVEHVRLTQSAERICSWDFPGARLELLDGEDVDVLEGIRCLFTPGHTAGHQSVLLTDDGVKTLFIGDAVYTSDVWEHADDMSPEHPAFALQVQTPELAETWRRSAEKLRMVDADVLHFAHDENVVCPHGSGRR